MAGADEAEFEAYAARDGGRLLGFAVLLAGGRQDAEDLVQQALLRSAVRFTSPVLVAADATGDHLLVSGNRFGRLDHGRFTALPGVASQSAIAAAW